MYERASRQTARRLEFGQPRDALSWLRVSSPKARADGLREAPEPAHHHHAQGCHPQVVAGGAVASRIATAWCMDWQRGEIVPPPNDFCRLSLFSRGGPAALHPVGAGAAREVQGQQEAAPRARSTTATWASRIVGAPLYVARRVRGLPLRGGLRCASRPRERDAELLKAQDRASCNTGATGPGARGGAHSGDGRRGVREADGPARVRRSTRSPTTRRSCAQGGRASSRSRRELSRAATASRTSSASSGPMLEVFRLLEKVCQLRLHRAHQRRVAAPARSWSRAPSTTTARARTSPSWCRTARAFNDNLLESALFGHVQGRLHRRASRDKKGLFEVADGGTFFLDEVGDMSPPPGEAAARAAGGHLHARGRHRSRSEVDVRVIAATHMDLARAGEAGRVPRGPLLPHQRHPRAAAAAARAPGRPARCWSTTSCASTTARASARRGARARGAWRCSPPTPGRATSASWRTRSSGCWCWAATWSSSPASSSPAASATRWSPAAAASCATARATGKLNDAVEMLEREMIQQGLLRTGNNKSRLARELGISRSNLILKIAKYGLDKGLTGADAEEAERVSAMSHYFRQDFLTRPRRGRALLPGAGRRRARAWCCATAWAATASPGSTYALPRAAPPGAALALPRPRPLGGCPADAHAHRHALHLR